MSSSVRSLAKKGHHLVFASPLLEIVELFCEVFGTLAGEVGIDRQFAEAVQAMALLAFDGLFQSRGGIAGSRRVKRK